MSRGSKPYHILSNDEVEQQLLSGYRLPRDPETPEKVYVEISRYFAINLLSIPRYLSITFCSILFCLVIIWEYNFRYDIMLQCWRESPIDRPDFKTIVETIKPMCKTKDSKVLSVEEQGKKSFYLSRHPTGSMVVYLVACHQDMSVLTKSMC